MKRRLGILFMVLGVICLVGAIGLLLYNNAESEHAKERSAAILEDMVVLIAENEAKEITVDPFEEEMPVATIDGNGYIGYLSVPVLDLELPVMADWDYDKLKEAPCRYYGSALTHNLVIAAHDYRYHFGYLGNLNQGDMLTFTDITL